MTTDIYDHLNRYAIPYSRHDHPPLFTCEDAVRLNLKIPGADTKNLFLRDKRGSRHLLVVVRHDSRVDLVELAAATGSDRLSFASPDRLKRYLGVEPGSVSLLGLMNDLERKVEVFIERSIWEAEDIQMHPLINTATLVVPKVGLLRFLEVTGHSYTVLPA